MPLIITPEKLFETAIQIERNGALFYSTAAKMASTKSLSRRLEKLAAAEEEHLQRFSRLKEMLGPDSRVVDWFQNEDGLKYLQMSANSGIFNMTTDAAAAVAAFDSMVEILTSARERERDSILFYSGIKAAMPGEMKQEKIDAIIYEEISHIVALETELESLKGK